MVTACSLLIAFCFINLVYYMQATSKLDQLSYDMSTITAGDFTVELDINKEMYRNLQERYEEDDDSKKYTRGLYLKKLLMTEVS